MAARYLEWNYDTKQIVEYRRDGECSRCGECCWTLVRFGMAGNGDGRQDSQTTDGTGIWAEVARDGLARYMIKLLEADKPENPCSGLLPGCTCIYHLDKTRICAEWPFHPSHVSPFARCSYSFQEIARWSLGD